MQSKRAALEKLVYVEINGCYLMIYGHDHHKIDLLHKLCFQCNGRRMKRHLSCKTPTESISNNHILITLVVFGWKNEKNGENSFFFCSHMKTHQIN